METSSIVTEKQDSLNTKGDLEDPIKQAVLHIFALFNLLMTLYSANTRNMELLMMPLPVSDERDC